MQEEPVFDMWLGFFSIILAVIATCFLSGQAFNIGGCGPVGEAWSTVCSYSFTLECQGRERVSGLGVWISVFGFCFRSGVSQEAFRFSEVT